MNINCSMDDFRNGMRFLKQRQQILICLPQTHAACTSISAAVIEKGAEPVFPEDLRWITLLRLLFSKHISAIAAFPQVLLGLSKLSAVHTPLYIRHAVVLGDPRFAWMKGEIERGLDCSVELCFNKMSEEDEEASVTTLTCMLLSWSSVLDCRAYVSAFGTELELVSVHGKKLPELPSVAKLLLREWEPGKDTPICLRAMGEINGFP